MNNYPRLASPTCSPSVKPYSFSCLRLAPFDVSWSPFSTCLLCRADVSKTVPFPTNAACGDGRCFSTDKVVYCPVVGEKSSDDYPIGNTIRRLVEEHSQFNYKETLIEQEHREVACQRSEDCLPSHDRDFLSASKAGI